MSRNNYKYPIIKIIFICLTLIWVIPSKGQIDSTTQESYHSPHKASVLSAVLPGAGQFYNGKYWKAPIIYAGFMGSGYAFYTNSVALQETNDRFREMYANGAAPSPQEIADRDQLRVNRDIGGLFFVGIYILQIIDATVDAHFYKFDINQSLSLSWLPKSPTEQVSLNILIGKR